MHVRAILVATEADFGLHGCRSRHPRPKLCNVVTCPLDPLLGATHRSFESCARRVEHLDALGGPEVVVHSAQPMGPRCPALRGPRYPFRYPRARPLKVLDAERPE